MNQFTILNKQEIQSILTMDMVIEAVEQAYSYKCSNLAELFPIVCHSFEDGVSEFDHKSGAGRRRNLRRSWSAPLPETAI